MEAVEPEVETPNDSAHSMASERGTSGFPFFQASAYLDHAASSREGSNPRRSPLKTASASFFSAFSSCFCSCSLRPRAGAAAGVAASLCSSSGEEEDEGRELPLVARGWAATAGVDFVVVLAAESWKNPRRSPLNEASLSFFSFFCYRPLPLAAPTSVLFRVRRRQPSGGVVMAAEERKTGKRSKEVGEIPSAVGIAAGKIVREGGKTQMLRTAIRRSPNAKRLGMSRAVE